MTDPRRSEPAAAGDPPERDRESQVEDLLLSGLEHYFRGEHEQAINIWTRVLFVDRGHARARAYIERARGAIAERQREGEELIHAGAAAFQRGDVETARRLLTAAVERGAASEGTLALLDRVERLELAAQPHDRHQRPAATPAARWTGRERTVSRPGGGRLGWVAAGVLLGMAAALALFAWGGEGLLITAPPADTAAPAALQTPLHVPTPAEIALTRARALFEKGRVRDALVLLETIRPGDALRPQADDLRAAIQRRLLETRRAEASAR